MGYTVDNRVVEMQFDNKQFERNVDQSINTLDRLKDALKLEDSAKAFSQLDSNIRSVTFEPLAKALDNINSHFTIFGKTIDKFKDTLASAIVDTTKKIYALTIGQIKSGGMTRAMNIEQAKFQLKGLGIAWDEVSGSIDYAVDGTAYGLDQAAKAASQLSASGVQLGQDMSNSLRAISGVAAMTNRDYDEIANIFVTVAAKNKLMNAEITRFSERGLNVSAKLAESFGVTESELLDMVSKGKVSFQEFADAMDDAFGEHAKDANSTFTGAMSNVKAALSRIGALFATPYMANMIEVFNALRVTLNKIKAELEPVANGFDTFFTVFTHGLSKLITSNEIFQIITNTVTTLKNIFMNLVTTLDPVGKAFKAVFPTSLLEIVKNLSERLVTLSQKIWLNKDTANALYNVAKGVFSLIKLFVNGVQTLIKVLSPLTIVIGGIIEKIVIFLGKIGEVISGIADFIIQNDYLYKVLVFVYEFVDALVSDIITTIKDLIKAFEDFTGIKIRVPNLDDLKKFGEEVAEILSPAQIIVNGVKKAFGILIEVIKGAMPIFVWAKNIVIDILRFLRDTVLDFVSGFNVDKIMKVIKLVIIIKILKTLYTTLMSLKNLVTLPLTIGSNINGVFVAIKGYFTALKKSIQVNYLLQIAMAIGILAVSLYALSKIDFWKLVQATTAILVLEFSLTKVFEQINKTLAEFQAQGLLKSSTVIIAIAVGILILASAVKTLASIDVEDFGRAMAGVTWLLISFTVAIIALSKYTEVMKVESASLIAFAFAISILAGAVQKLSSCEKLLAPMIAITFLFIEFVGATVILSEYADSFSLGTAVAMIALAVAINVLASAVKELADTPWPELRNGLIGVFVLLMEISVFLNLMEEKSGFGILSGIGLIALAYALNMLITPLKEMSEMENSARALITMAGALVILGKVTELFDWGTLLAGAALIVLAEGFKILTPTLMSLTNVKWTDLLNSFAKFTAIVVGVSVVANVLSALSVGIGIFALALTALAIPVMLAAAGISLIVSALGNLAAMGGDAFDRLSKVITTIIESIAQNAEKIGGIIVELMLKFGEGIVKIIEAIGDGAPKIGIAAMKIVTTIVLVLEHAAKMIIDSVIGIIDNVLSTISAHSGSIADSVLSIMENVINTIADHSDRIVSSIINLLGSITIAMINALPQILATIVRVLESVIEMIKTYAPKFLEKGKELFNKLVEGIKSIDVLGIVKSIISGVVSAVGNFVGDMVQKGKDFIGGFIHGLSGGEKEAYDAGKDFGESSVDGLGDGIDAHSDSKLTAVAAKYFAGGFVNTLTDKFGEARDAGFGFGDNAGEGIYDGLEGWEGSIDEFFDDQTKKIWTYEQAVASMAKEGRTVSAGDFRMLDQQGIKDAEEAKKTADIFEELGKSSGKAGGSSSKASEKVKELMDVEKETADVSAEFADRFGAAFSYIDDQDYLLKIQETLENFGYNLDTSSKDYDKLKETIGNDSEAISQSLTLAFAEMDKAAETRRIDTISRAMDNFADFIFETSDDYLETVKGMEKGTEDYLEAMKKAWDEYGKALKSALELDPLEAFSNEWTVKTKDLLKNMQSNMRAMEQFDIVVAGVSERFAELRLSPEILNELVKTGYKALPQLTGMLQATDDELIQLTTTLEDFKERSQKLPTHVMASLALAVDAYKTSVANAQDGTNEFIVTMEQLERVSERVTALVIARYDQMYDKISSVLESQIDIFSEFTEDEEDALSPSELFSYLDQNTKGVEKWRDNLGKVIEKGLDDSVIQKLVDLGPKSAKELEAFAQMTTTQIQQYNEKYAKLMELEDSAAAQIAQSYAVAGKNVVEGFAKGLEETGMAKDAAMSLANQSLDELKKVLDINSPSGVTLKYGLYVVEGLRDGIKNAVKTVIDPAKNLADTVINTILKYIKLDEIKKIGANICNTLADSINANTSRVQAAATKLANVVKSATEAGVEIGSPSKWAWRVGRFIDQGLANGLTDNADTVEDSMYNMTDLIKRVKEVLDGELEYDPTIKPVLDLSNVTGGMNDLNNLLNQNATISMARNISASGRMVDVQGLDGNTNNTQTISINNYVYGAQGQDPNELVDVLNYKLGRQLRRLEVIQ